MCRMKRVVSSVLLTGVLFLSTWLIGGCARLGADLPDGPPIWGDDFPRITRSYSDERLSLVLKEVIRISPEGLGTLERSLFTFSPPLVALYREYWDQFEKDPVVREDFFDQLQQEYVPFLSTQVERVQMQRTPSEPTVVRNAGEISLTAQLPHLANYDPKSATWLVSVGPQNLNALDVIWNQMLTEMIFRALFMESLPGNQRFELHRETKFELPKGAVLTNRQELEGSQWYLDFGGGIGLKAALKVEDHAVTIVEDLVQAEAELTNLMTGEEGTALFDNLGKYKAFVIKYSQDPQVAASVAPGTVTPQSRPNQFSKSWQATFQSPTFNISFDGLPRGSSLTLSAATGFTLGSFIGWRFSRNGRLEWFDANITVNPQLTIGASVSVSTPLSWNKKKKTPWEPKIDIWFLIGVLPVVISLQAQLEGTAELGVSGTSSLSLTTGGNINSTTGVLYNNGWQKKQSFNINFRRPSVTLSSTSALTASVGPQLTLGAYIYYLAGPFASLRISLDGQLNVRPSRTWIVEGVVKASGGFKTSRWLADFLGMDISLAYDFYTWKWKLADGMW